MWVQDETHQGKRNELDAAGNSLLPTRIRKEKPKEFIVRK